MYQRYLGISAVALAGLFALANDATAQNRTRSSGERREGASSENRAGAENRDGARRDSDRSDAGRWEGETRSGYYYGPYGGRGIYGPGYSTFMGPRYYYRYGYPGYSDNGMYYGNSNFDNTYYSDGSDASGYYDDNSWDGGRRRGRLFGRRRGGWSDYSYGSYGYGSGSSCHGGCHGSYGSGCTGGYYGSGCSGSRSYYGAPARDQGGYSYGESGMNGASLGNAALIDVRVAPSATITFDDQPTQQTGEFRQFMTPPLEPGKNFSYTVHAKWQEGGRDMDQSRKVSVQAGQQTQVDFNTAQAKGSQGNRAPEQAPRPGQGANIHAPAPAPEARDRNQAPAPAPDARDRNAPQASGESHEGTFISFNNGTLELTDPQHGKHSHHLSQDTQVTIDGRPAKAEDLKADMKIKITAKKGDPNTITKIEATSKDKDNGDRGTSNKETPPPPQP